MHTTMVGDTTFIHNGDYSGELYVLGKETDSGEVVKVETTMQDLVRFVIESMRVEMIGVVEQASPSELLKMSAKLGVHFPGGS